MLGRWPDTSSRDTTPEEGHMITGDDGVRLDGQSVGRGFTDDTWVIIPVFNEHQVVGEVISDIRRIFPNVVCVDDGSRDNSAEICRAAGAEVVRHPVNLGQGGALETGFEFVRRFTDARFAVTFDADGQHDPHDALAMLEHARVMNLAFVFGSRFLDDRTKVSTPKKLVLRLAAFFTRLSTGLRLTDAHNGLRVIRRDALESFSLTQTGMAHASEIVSVLARTKLPGGEFPVHIRYTDYSKAKGQSLLNSVNILVDLFVR